MTTRARARTFCYVVEGRVAFPIDMLRYDRSTPRSERDSYAIERMTRERRSSIAQRIELQGSNAPAEKRWESFGWRVSSVQVLS